MHVLKKRSASFTILTFFFNFIKEILINLLLFAVVYLLLLTELAEMDCPKLQEKQFLL